MTIELKKIKQLIELFEQSNLTEIEIKEDKDSVRLSRQQAVQPIQISSSNYPNYPAVGSGPVQNSPGNSNPVAAPVLETPGHKICSPMVGTFYAAPTPDARPFVEVGQTVKPGDVLCIIEAMKMLNQIEADRAGVISKILIQNAEPVEYDQVLFIITE